MRATADEQLRVLLDGIVQVVPQRDFETAVRQAAAGERPPLRVKFGVDPTRPDLHLGHAVPLRKLRQFQRFGHTAVLVVGGFTAQVGDPSGRSTQRTVLTPEEVRANARTYLDQVRRVLLDDPLEIVDNADWLSPMRLEEVVQVTSRVTVAQILEREDFARRLAGGGQVSLLEMFYPVLQGQDSVAIRADVEIGGTDQTFNMLVGRDLQQAAGQRPQAVMTLPLLVGLDGDKKMSKSADNYVAFEDPPEVMVRKLRGLPMRLLEDYLRLATDAHPDEVDRVAAGLRDGSMPTADVARRVGREVAASYWGREAADRAEAMVDREPDGQDAAQARS